MFEINYSGSGIKTLRTVSIITFIAHVIIALIFIIVPLNSYFPVSYAAIAFGVVIFFNGLFIMAFGLVLSTIAESVLYQKQKQQHSEFWDD